MKDNKENENKTDNVYSQIDTCKDVTLDLKYKKSMDDLKNKKNKNKKDIINIIQKQYENKVWCRTACQKTLMLLDKYNDTDTLEYILSKEDISSEWAFWWAYDVGDEDLMIDKIDGSKWAYFWGGIIGNQDIMINKMTESEWIDKWIRDIGDREYFENKELIK